jgi:dTDP-4-dehydrorhamnose 3,5-epimerase
MQVTPTAIPDVKIIEPRVFGDDRGFFMESWNAAAFAEAGLDFTFVQDNHSKSAKGVLRGLHYQIGPAQGKLVRVIAGSVFDVAVDMRRSSPTFGRWVAEVLSAANKRMLWIPEGFAHGFLALEDGTEFLYKCTARRSQSTGQLRARLWCPPRTRAAKHSQMRKASHECTGPRIARAIGSRAVCDRP